MTADFMILIPTVQLTKLKSIPIKTVVTKKQSNRLASFLDDMFWFLGPSAIFLALVASYNTFQYLAWPEVEGKVMAIAYTCHSSKKSFWQKRSSKIYYSCGDQMAIGNGRSEGFEPGGARYLEFTVQFVSLYGDTQTALISAYEQDVHGKNNLGVYSVRYSRFNPNIAKFSDLTRSNMQDFWLMAIVAGVAAFFCRKFSKSIE
jgi:hypothetical protein